MGKINSSPLLIMGGTQGVITSLQDRIEANPDAYYDSDTSLSDYHFEDDLMEDPLDQTLEGISSRNRRKGE